MGSVAQKPTGKMIGASYLRLRHTYGHGVHSPYSYNLVKRVLSPGKYIYYGYDDIEAAANASDVRAGSRIERNARRLLRFMAEEDIRSIYFPDKPHPVYKAAAQAAYSQVRITQGGDDLANCQLILTSGEKIPLEILKKTVSTEGKSLIAIGLSEEWKNSLYETMSCGVMFHSPGMAVFLPRTFMGKISYSVML